jgi:streptomycin 6-kinase
MNLPPDFVNNIIHSYGDAGRRYLADLPDLLSAAAKCWDLTLGEPFLLSYNYVCAATRRWSSSHIAAYREVPGGGDQAQDCVLKIGVPNIELTSEINTLRVYDGQGACRLYESDSEAGMLLLERLRPGEMLVTLTDDDRATEIAADTMKQTQRPAPTADGFLSLRGWFDELQNLRPRFGGGTGPFREKTVDIVEEMVRELFAEERPQVLLHGDFHHYNILSSDRGWLVIDPKGVIGAPEYDACPFLINPIGGIPDEAEAIRRTRRRIAILSERLGFDRQRVWRWAVCFSLLSDFWDAPTSGPMDGFSPIWTEIFLQTKV